MFIARHEKVSHSILLPISADEAIEFFTPEGERMWVEGWAPHYFHPANGETIDSRVTPGSRSTLVEVSAGRTVKVPAGWRPAIR